MLIEQVPPAATLLPHVFVWLKSPVGVMLAMLNAVARLFLSVTADAALVVPTF
jgi:hypothetical protein